MSNAVMNTVYNHYLTTYAPKSTTQYDTHKKSELKSIYSSIVKLNKESPWYLDVHSRDTQQYAVALKENARLLRNTIASLGDLEGENALAQKAAYSSDESIVSAVFTGEIAEDTPSPTLEISVFSLASPQENMGTFLSDERIRLPEDTYSFDVSINDLNYEFQFNINDGDTNRDVQERLVRLINNSEIGIQARLEEGDARSSIRLTSVSTGLPNGKENIFTITDDHTGKAAGAVEYFGLNCITRTPANSSFLLNGEERSTASNTFTVGKMYELELKGISAPDTSVTVGLKNDVESLNDNINTLVGSYNHFLTAAGSYRDTQQLSGRLVREMGHIASAYHSHLEQMGLHLQNDYTISVDEERLKEAASTDLSFDKKTLKEFVSSLYNKSMQVSLNPMNYANRTIVAYKNPGRSFATPYITSAYSGMMFNSYC